MFSPKHINMTRILSGAFAICAIALFSAFTLGMQTIKIQTTAVCGMCKDRIESVLGATEGVESARLDLTTKKVKIKFDDTKQSEASLRAIIAKSGYGADNVEADAAAFEALPGCCKSKAACDAKKAMMHGDEQGDASMERSASDASAVVAKDAQPAAKACCAGKAKSAKCASASAEAGAASEASMKPAAKACCAKKGNAKACAAKTEGK